MWSMEDEKRSVRRHEEEIAASNLCIQRGKDEENSSAGEMSSWDDERGSGG